MLLSTHHWIWMCFLVLSHAPELPINPIFWPAGQIQTQNSCYTLQGTSLDQLKGQFIKITKIINSTSIYSFLAAYPSPCSSGSRLSKAVQTSFPPWDPNTFLGQPRWDAICVSSQSLLLRKPIKRRPPYQMPKPHGLAPLNRKAKGSTLSSLRMFEIFNLSSRVSPATLQNKLIFLPTCDL